MQAGLLFGQEDEAGATFSPDRVYRFGLWRRRFPGRPVALWIMLNPSTADEFQLDPTLKRCQGFSLAWGYPNFEVCNLFGLRSTDPAGIYQAADPVGPGNDEAILDAAARANLIVVGWGNHGTHLGRNLDVRQLLAGAGHQVKCLGLTKTGQPKHPLYLDGETTLTDFQL